MCAGYRYELSLVLNGTSPIPDFSSLEHEIFHRFRSSRLPASPLRSLSPISSFPLPLSLALSPQPSSPRSKRDWSTKTHFNYLLLDVTRLKQHRGERRESLESFREFVEAVFYVGKGKNARSLQHLKEAREKIGLPLAKVRPTVVCVCVCVFVCVCVCVCVCMCARYYFCGVLQCHSRHSDFNSCAYTIIIIII